MITKKYLEIYNRAKKLKQEYGTKVDYIKNNYAAVAIDGEISKLQQDYNKQFADMRLETTRVLSRYQTEKKAKETAYRMTEEYKSKLDYAINMISKFPKMEQSSYEQILQPLVEAGDIMSLSILQQNDRSNLAFMKAISDVNKSEERASDLNRYLTDYLQDYTTNDVNLTIEGILHKQANGNGGEM